VRGAGDIIGHAFEIYGKNARQLLVIVAVISVPLSVLSWLITQIVLGPKTRSVVFQGRVLQVPEPRSAVIGVLSVLVGLVITIIISAILQAALLRGASQATIGDPVDVQTSYRWGLRRFGGVILVSLLVAIAVFLGFVPGIVIALGIPVLGVIVAIIGGIVLLILLSMSTPALVVENLRATDAMRRSWKLVRAHFWHALSVILVASLITGLVGGLIGAIGGSNDVLRLIFGAVARILVAPYSALVSVLLYVDLRARGEGLTPSGLRAELAHDV